MHTTSRTRSVECPACEGECGEHAPTNGLFGSGSYTEWFPCEACEGEGRVQRVERLAWLIGEARESEPRLSPLTMPVFVRTEVPA